MIRDILWILGFCLFFYIVYLVFGGETKIMSPDKIESSYFDFSYGIIYFERTYENPEVYSDKITAYVPFKGVALIEGKKGHYDGEVDEIKISKLFGGSYSLIPEEKGSLHPYLQEEIEYSQQLFEHVLFNLKDEISVLEQELFNQE